MAKIIGNTTVTPYPRPDWNQTDTTKADYIKNKPAILTEEDVVELIGANGGTSGGGTIVNQVQSDWSQSDETKLDYIKNKPALATVAISGSYNDLSDLPTEDFPRIFYCNTWTESTTYDRDFVKENTYPQNINVKTSDYILSDDGLYLIQVETSHLYKANKIVDLSTESGIAEETDPTVPEWAKQSEKPKYAASEITYNNDGLDGQLNTVQSALDKSVEFVVDESPDLIAKKHEHNGNIETLNKLSETNGSLIYDGVPLAYYQDTAKERPTKTLNVVSTEGYVEQDVPAPNCFAILDAWGQLTDDDVSDGTEIKKIEFNLTDPEAEDGWVDINEMYTVDGIPYHISMSKVFRDVGDRKVFALASYVFVDKNYIYDMIASMTPIYIRITLYTD